MAGEVSNQQVFIETIQSSLSPEVGESLMTIAQQLEAKGEARGIAKGKSKGKLEGKAETHTAIAQKCLEQGMALEAISQITGLSLETI